LDTESTAIENAVDRTLREGLRTADISGGKKSVSTKEMGSAIIENITTNA
jgi:isocitrate/isopropylmalate dehydrogenase